MIKGYNTYNGIFNASKFMEELLKKQKKIRFIGTGTSHQNWASESTVKVVVTMKRTTLVHATLRCTEETMSNDICAMAMDYAVWVYNRIPDIKSGSSAIAIW